MGVNRRFEQDVFCLKQYAVLFFVLYGNAHETVPIDLNSFKQFHLLTKIHNPDTFQNQTHILIPMLPVILLCPLPSLDSHFLISSAYFSPMRTSFPSLMVPSTIGG